MSWSRPPHIVPNQLNTFTAEGRAIIIVESMNVAPRAGFMPDWNMWCPHTMKPSSGDPGDREDHRLVAEQRLAREGRDHVGDEAHRRQDHDVDGRVRVEPEQVLPHERLAAAHHRRGVGARVQPTRLKKLVPAVRSEQLHHQGRGQDRQRERLQGSP